MPPTDPSLFMAFRDLENRAASRLGLTQQALSRGVFVESVRVAARASGDPVALGLLADADRLVWGIVTKNAGLALQIARRLSGEFALEDAESAALLGLHRAILRYEPTRGPLQNFASAWIKSSIYREKHRYTTGAEIGYGAILVHAQVKRTLAQSPDATPEAIDRIVGQDAWATYRRVEAGKSFVQLDATPASGDHDLRPELEGDQPSPDHTAEVRITFIRLVDELLSHHGLMKPRSRRIVESLLNGATQQEAATEHGVSRQRVGQILELMKAVAHGDEIPRPSTLGRPRNTTVSLPGVPEDLAAQIRETLAAQPPAPVEPPKKPATVEAARMSGRATGKWAFLFEQEAA